MKIQDCLRQNNERERKMEVLLMGDFNFTDEEVTWVTLDDEENGISAIASEGDTHEKAAFNTLLNLTEDFSLSQIVDKPTFIRGNNILDLIFVTEAVSWRNCSTDLIHPMSDHHLVKIDLLCHANEEATDPLPPAQRNKYPISTFNFELADKESMLVELKKNSWHQMINTNMDRNQMETPIRKAVEEAAVLCKVPKNNTTGSKPAHKPAVARLMAERLKLNSLLKHQREDHDDSGQATKG